MENSRLFGQIYSEVRLSSTQLNSACRVTLFPIPLVDGIQRDDICEAPLKISEVNKITDIDLQTMCTKMIMSLDRRVVGPAATVEE